MPLEASFEEKKNLNLLSRGKFVELRLVHSRPHGLIVYGTYSKTCMNDILFMFISLSLYDGI